MNDLFLMRSDLFPFPGACGIEYLALRFWRIQAWIAAAILIAMLLERITEGCRTRFTGWAGRILSVGLLLTGSFLLAAVAWQLYRRAPLCEFVIQWNTRFSGSEVALVSLGLLALAGYVRRKLRSRYAAWRLAAIGGLLVWFVAAAGAALCVASLWWRRPAYRPVSLAMAEYLISLVVVLVLLVRFARPAWRGRTWKMLFPMSAWLAALVFAVIGCLEWVGAAGWMIHSCR